MKKLILALCFCVPLICNSQCYLQPNGVTTDPRNNFQNAENPVDPIYTNQFFDWTQDFFHNLNWQSTSGPTSANQPHSLPDNSTTLIYNNDDFNPENGWELLRFNKGYINYWEDDEGIGTPNTTNNSVYYILYNKYRSLIRVYFMISPSQADYDYFRVNLKFNDEQYNRTAILSSAEKVIKPLIHFEPTLAISSTNQFYNSDYLWYYADFTVMYDPCTCDNTLEMEFQLETVNEVDIVINGTSQGQIEMLNSSNSVNNFASFTGAAQSVANNVQSGQKYFKDLSSFFGNVDDNTSGDNDTKDRIRSGLQHLDSWFGDDKLNFLRHLPYLGEALSLVNIFVGSKSNQIPPMGMELSHHFSGTFSDIIPRDLFTMQMPGSANIQHNNRYPLYNEVLGVANILDRPKINTVFAPRYLAGSRFRNKEQYVIGMWAKHKIGASLSSDEEIKIIINPASDLELIEVYGQLHFNFLSDIPLDWIENKDDLTIVDSKNYLSPIVPLSCLTNYAFFIDIYKETLIGDDVGYNISRKNDIINAVTSKDYLRLFNTVSLVITMNLKNSDGKQFIHRYSFEANNITKNVNLDYYGHDYFGPGFYVYRNINDDIFWGSSNINWSFFDKEHNFTYENQIINESKIVKDWISVKGTTEIIEQTNGQRTTLTAGRRINIEENVDIEPGVELKIDITDLDCAPTIPLASVSDIENICTDLSYLDKAMPMISPFDENYSDKEDFSNIEIHLYPNPTSNYFLVTASNFNNNFQANVNVFDLQGKSVLNKKLMLGIDYGEQKIDFDLNSGVYIVEIIKPDRSSFRKKLIIKK